MNSGKATNEMRILNGSDIARLLSMEACIAAVDAAMRAAAAGRAAQPPRQVLKLLGGEGLYGLMPGELQDADRFGAKIVSVFERSPSDPLQSHQGLVILFDRETGLPAGIADGGAVTGIRTAAATAVATRALARDDAARLAICGTGHQAAKHIEAICAVRPISEVAVWGRDGARAAAFVEKAARAHPQLTVRMAATPREAAENAEIICTVTSAFAPFLSGDMIAPGAHVNAVGSSVPAQGELDPGAMARGRLFVDSEASARAQSGEFLRAVEAGLIGEDHLLGEIGAVLSGDLPGRRSSDEVTIYKSLGVAAQDIAATAAALAAAEEAGIGVEIDMDARR